jgi:hypothetical protein
MLYFTNAAAIKQLLQQMRIKEPEGRKENMKVS